MSDHGFEGDQAQALATRLFTAGLATAELMTTYLGAKLGLYNALARSEPLTAGALAKEAGIAPRYACEWLEQQAASGVLEVDDPAMAAEVRLYLLPEGHREALTDRESRYWITPMAMFAIGSIARAVPDLLEAYRNGGGIDPAAYGGDYRFDLSSFNCGVFRDLLPRWILTLLPDLHAAWTEGGLIADVGCGLGWSSICLAKSYPRLTIEGFDIDEGAVALARANAMESGVGERVTFATRDAGTLRAEGVYQTICIFDALHDMPRPVEALAACRRALKPGGCVLLMEPNAGETFRTPAEEGERFLYAISLLHCLPLGLSEEHSAATGTVMRPSTLRAYAEKAGFSRVTVHAVDHRLYRLYRLFR